MDSKCKEFKCKGTDEEWEKYLNKLSVPRDDKSIVFSRFVSYDFCYNYFQDFYINHKTEELASAPNLNLACLHLAFYLASWRMYRRGAQTRMSYKVFEGVVKRVAHERELWKYDVEDYHDTDKRKKIIEFSKEIQEILSGCFKENNEVGRVTETLTTKIMLGIFGCVPALDVNFNKFIKDKNKVVRLNDDALTHIHCCYLQHKELIDSKKIKSLTEDFHETQHLYKKARLIDYVGFCIGEQLNKPDNK